MVRGSVRKLVTQDLGLDYGTISLAVCSEQGPGKSKDR
jgi:hypothetical protein